MSRGLAPSSAFEPVFDEEARVLVLGSLPGVRSLERGQYYAHPQNAFWRIMGALLGGDLVALPYEARLEALRRSRVALWDSIATAVRPGSLDADVRDATPADLPGLVARLPALRAVAFNGALSAKIGRRQLAGTRGPALLDMPSTSPANAGLSFEEKLKRWSKLVDYLA